MTLICQIQEQSVQFGKRQKILQEECHQKMETLEFLMYITAGVFKVSQGTVGAELVVIRQLSL